MTRTELVHTSDGSKPDVEAKKSAHGKRKLKIIGRELPDLDTDEQFQANWKISKAKEVRLLLDSHCGVWYWRDFA
jgi:hypothetical protein